MKVALCLLALVATAFAAHIKIQEGKTSHPHLEDNSRIVGGQVVDIAFHPHQISLRKKDILAPELAYRHSCGGSIYSENIVITASHCVIAKVPSQFQVVAGSSNRSGNDGAIVPVKEIIMHENYEPDSYNYDIAILVLGAPLPLNNYTIKAIGLAETEPRSGAVAVTTGWGTTTQGGYLADTLQEVRVPIISNEDCNEDYQGLITDSMLCAGLRGVGGKDACQGDSGGPLLVNGKLTGVVSWGYGCARPEYPGVYARVPYLRSWILEQVAKIESRDNLN